MELTAFLPENSQAAIVQPIGTRGVLVLGHNRVRGFTKARAQAGWPRNSTPAACMRRRWAVTAACPVKPAAGPGVGVESGGQDGRHAGGTGVAAGGQRLPMTGRDDRRDFNGMWHACTL